MSTDTKMDVDQKDDDNKNQDDNKMNVDSDDDVDDKIIDTKPTSDIEEKVNIILAETSSSASASSNLMDGIDKLLYLEKKQRQSEHEGNTLFISLSILDLCKNNGDWNITIEQIAILSRRRSQFRRVIMRIVQYTMKWINDLNDNKNIKLKLIQTLISVTEGKIFVEVERARLTRKLCEIKEKEENNINDACDILQELQIETFGSMKKKEKCDFLLEQFRLNLAKRDFIRAGIVRNKITEKVLKNFVDLERKYWNLSLILFYHHEKQYLKLSLSYYRLKDLMTTKKEKLSALSSSIFALILSKYSNEQNDMLYRILYNESKLLELLPTFRQILLLLTKIELIEWPLKPVNMKNELISFRFIGVIDSNQDFKQLLNDKIIQHNIRVIEKYYNRISIKRLSQFLSININKTEEYISQMVIEKIIFARINRLKGIIRFKKKNTTNQILNLWKSDTDKLLDLVDLTCHQIHKEMVIHKAKGKKSKK